MAILFPGPTPLVTDTTAGLARPEDKKKLDSLIFASDFGADPSLNDNASAIQAALNAAGENGCLIFTVPGTYYIRSTLFYPNAITIKGRGSEQMPAASGGVRLEWRDITVNQPALAPVANPAGTTVPQRLGLWTYIYTENIALVGPPATKTGTAIYGSNINLGVGTVIYRWKIGVDSLAGYYSALIDTDISWCEIGLRLSTPGVVTSEGEEFSTTCYNTDIRGTRFRYCDGACIEAGAVIGLRVSSSSLEGASGLKITAPGGHYIIRDTYYENPEYGLNTPNDPGFILAVTGEATDILLEGNTIYADRTLNAIDVSAWANAPAINRRCSLLSRGNQIRGTSPSDEYAFYKLPNTVDGGTVLNHLIDIRDDSVTLLTGNYSYIRGQHINPRWNIHPPYNVFGRTITEGELRGGNLLAPNVALGGDALSSTSGFVLQSGSVGFTYLNSQRQAYRGKGAVLLTCNTAASHVVALSKFSAAGAGTALPVTPGVNYSMMTHFRRNTGSMVEVRLVAIWRDSSWNTISQPAVGAIQALPGWQQLRGTSVAPAGAAYLNLTIQILGTSAGQTFIVDSSYVVEGVFSGDFLLWDELVSSGDVSFPLVTSSSAGLQPASGYDAIAYASQVTLDFAALNGQMKIITLTGPLELLTSNLAAGREVRLNLIPGASQRTLTFPNDWKFFSDKPASLPANKEAILILSAFGSDNSNVKAVIFVQP